jgi:TolA-binding protein
MRGGPGDNPMQDEQPAGDKEFLDGIERKSPGWFGGPQTGSAAEEMALAGRMRENGEPGKAAKRYNALVTEWGDAAEAPAAQQAYADLLMEERDMEDAFREYQYLIKFYAGQFDYDAVLEKQMQIANYIMTTPRGKFLFFPGFNSPESAIPYYKQIVANGPKWRRAPEAQFNVGVINEDIDDFEEAILAYDSVMNRFHDNELAPKAAFRKAVCLVKLWKKTPRDERSLREALSGMATFVANYPASDNIPGANDYLADMGETLAGMYFERAEFYETINRNDEAAIIAYSEFVRQFPSSKKAVAAQNRIEELRNRKKTE